jgi:hypothetical protein
MNKQVHILWVYGNLSKLQKISARRFIQSGFEVDIQSYSDNINVPLGAKYLNVRDILNESRIFNDVNSSYARITNIFELDHY